MERIILLTCLLLTSCSTKEYTYKQDVKPHPIQVERSDWDIFIEALIQVESENNPQAVGSKDDVGILQITPIYVADVNRILGEEAYFLEDRTDRKKSLEMFRILQNHYNPKLDINKAIKLHNPRASSRYKAKILCKINKIKEKCPKSKNS